SVITGGEFSGMPKLLAVAMACVKRGRRKRCGTTHIEGTVWLRGGWMAHEHGMLCTCAPEMDRPPIHGVSLDISAQFLAVCSRLKWSRHLTKSPCLALLAMAGSNAAYKIISACSNAVS